MTLAFLIIQFISIPLLSPLCVGIIRKVKAKFQNRTGASIIQPYYDIWKLLHKDEVISKDATWVFRIAPFVVFAVTLVISISIPVFTSVISNPFTGDMLMIVYALAIGTFFLALAGMEIGTAFGGFGASREMTVAALAEGGLIFSLLTLAIISGSSNVFNITNSVLNIQNNMLLPIVLAAIAFFISMLAEASRYPFDNPSTHLELTMIHEAMIIEYSGKRLALMEWASANKLLILATIGANLFIPWGIAQNLDLGSLIIGVLIYLLKIIGICFGIAIIESSMAKFRFFRLPDLLTISFILNVLAISLIR